MAMKEIRSEVVLAYRSEKLFLEILVRSVVLTLIASDKGKLGFANVTQSISEIRTWLANRNAFKTQTVSALRLVSDSSAKILVQVSTIRIVSVLVLTVLESKF
jgi:hypothetical protein